MIIIDEFLEDIQNESYGNSTIKRTRKQKTSSTKATIAISLARQKNDPLYKKMVYYKQMYKKAKEMIESKYRSKSNQMAIKKASQYKKTIN